tara:strand:+ start:656 stop:943 length:288 start_codon:yes stop_codon:yes gene_type:complete
MLVKIKNVKVFRSLHGGHDCFRVDGLHQDETGEWVEGRTFVDPRMDNAGNWLEICEVGTQFRGKTILADYVHMKNRARGIYDADSRPHIVEIYDE